MATYVYQVSSASATAAGDLGIIAMAVRNDGAASQLNSAALGYGVIAVDASGRVYITGNVSATVNATAVTAFVSGQASALGVTGTITAFVSGQASAIGTTGTVTAFVSGQASALGVSGNALTATVTASASTESDAFAASASKGYVSFGLATAVPLTYSPSAFHPLSLDLNGNLRVTATAAWLVSGSTLTSYVSGQVTAVQGGTIWGVTASAVTAFLSGQAAALGITGNLSAVTADVTKWGDVAVTQATALANGMSAPTAPLIGSIGVGLRSDGTTNYDPAVLGKLFELNTGAGTEYVLGASLRVQANGGSVQLGAIDNAASSVAASGFIDGTSPVLPGGYLYDEVAGTTPTEDDILAARVDVKRAQVMVLEDATTRGLRAQVNSLSALSVQQYFTTGSQTMAFAIGLGGTSAITGGALNYTQIAPRSWTMFLTRAANNQGTATGYLQVSPDNTNWMTLISAVASSTNGLTATATGFIQALYGRIVLSASATASASASATGWLIGGM